MSHYTSRLFLLIFSTTLLAACGSSSQKLVTLLEKGSPKMEWAKVCGQVSSHNLPGEGSGVCWTKYERLNRTKQKVVLFAGVRMAERTRDQVLVFGLPRGVNVDQGIRVKFDDDFPLSLRYSHCDATACFAQMPMNKNLLVKLRYSKRMVVAVMSRYNKAYGYKIPMFRFIYAYDSEQREGQNNALRTASR